MKCDRGIVSLAGGSYLRLFICLAVGGMVMNLFTSDRHVSDMLGAVFAAGFATLVIRWLDRRRSNRSNDTK